MPLIRSELASNIRPVSRPAEKLSHKQATRSEKPFPLLWPLYCTLLLAAAAVAVGLNAPQFHGDPYLFLVLLGLNLAADRFPIRVYGDTYISIGFVLTMAIIIMFGVPGIVIAAPLEPLASSLGRRPLSKILANVGLTVVVSSAAAGAYQILAPVNPPTLDVTIALGTAAATSVSFFLTMLLLSLGTHFKTGEPVRLMWEKHRFLAPHYAAFGVIGLALAAACIGLGIVGVIAFATPAVMMRYSIKQYVDKTAENVERLKEKNEALETANIEIVRVSHELRQTYDGTLEALVTALDARDQETKGHSIRVARYMLNIAEALGVKEGSQDWVDMQRGALLHDVGKIGVPDAILLKPGKLTPEEWDAMRRHPEIGFRMLREVRFLSGAAEIVLAHHERWDGKGYPHGLRADGIPLGSRIFSVVDTFDSMTSDRPYRLALPVEEALNEIIRCSGSQFDPLVVEAFLDIYPAWVIERDLMRREAPRAA